MMEKGTENNNLVHQPFDETLHNKIINNIKVKKTLNFLEQVA